MESASSALRLLALVLVLALAACATPEIVESVPGAGARAEAHGWYGRFSATSTAPGDAPREERFSGRFLLRRVSGGSVIEISSVLGQTMAIAHSGPGGARLETADGKVYTAASAEELLEQVFGWRIPVSLLPDWLEGHFGADTRGAAGRSPAAAGAASAQAAAIVTEGWQVRVEELRNERPHRLALRWPEPPSPGLPALALLLIIDGREL